jgi:ABC-type xylose transport system substrate-binding protein
VKLVAKGIKVLIICRRMEPPPPLPLMKLARPDQGHLIRRLIRDTDAVDYYVTFDSIAWALSRAVPG